MDLSQQERCCSGRRSEPGIALSLSRSRRGLHLKANDIEQTPLLKGQDHIHDMEKLEVTAGQLRDERRIVVRLSASACVDRNMEMDCCGSVPRQIFLKGVSPTQLMEEKYIENAKNKESVS